VLNALAGESIRGVKVIPGFLEEFYDFRTSVTNFLDIRATKGDFILALIKHFPDITRK